MFKLKRQIKEYKHMLSFDLWSKKMVGFFPHKKNPRRTRFEKVTLKMNSNFSFFRFKHFYRASKFTKRVIKFLIRNFSTLNFNFALGCSSFSASRLLEGILRKVCKMKVSIFYLIRFELRK